MSILDKRKNLIKQIKKSKKVFLMAHKNLDLDALGACIGMSLIVSHFNKESYIVIDDKNHELGVKKILTELEGCFNFIKSCDVEDNLCSFPKKNLLIILDTNKEAAGCKVYKIMK